MRTEISDIAGFVKVIADDGKVLTFYNDEESMENYNGFTVVHVNHDYMLDDIREITAAQHEAYLEMISNGQ